MARVFHVKKAQKDNPVAKKGESYYWWKFRFGPKHYSKTPPRRSQLTQSEFLGEVYEIEDEIQDAVPEDREELRSMISDWTSRIEALGEEQNDRRDNMPEGLQEGEVGQLLEDRATACEDWVSSLEAVDLDADVDDDNTEADLLEAALDEVRSLTYEGE